MYFLVLQSSCWGRESWLLYFNCPLNVMWLLVFVTLPHGVMGWYVVLLDFSLTVKVATLIFISGRGSAI